MPRLLGVDIPNDKQVIYSLQYLYGVGPVIAREACVKTKINPNKQARDLDEDELSRLSTLLERDYTVEGPLRRHRDCVAGLGPRALFLQRKSFGA